MILGGIVKFEDGIKTTIGDQFSPTRKVSVELNFAVPEDPGIDADSVVQEVLDKAQAFVHTKLGLKAATPAAKTVVVETRQPIGQKEAAAAAMNAAEAPKKRGPKPKSNPAIEVAKIAPVSVNHGASGLEDWDHPNALPATASAQTEQLSGGAEVEDWDAPPAEITDKTLNDAVQVKNGKLNDPPKIRKLIADYAVGTPVLRAIPQEKRQEFLDKLAAL